MEDALPSLLKSELLFETERLKIINWVNSGVPSEFGEKLLHSVTHILSPEVTKDLPDGWQQIISGQKAEKWMSDRKAESHCYTIIKKSNLDMVGFMFLFPENNAKIRLGYLLKSEVWGQGLGTEVVHELLQWAKNSGIIKTISGGVEKDNIGSIRVLEKCGFEKSEMELPGSALLYSYHIKTHW